MKKFRPSTNSERAGPGDCEALKRKELVRNLCGTTLFEPLRGKLRLRYDVRLDVVARIKYLANRGVRGGK
jgi:hypothetical protein